jgi:hypothetical protein
VAASNLDLRVSPQDTVRLGVVTLDWIAWLMRESLEVAQRRFATLIDCAKAEKLLRQARAPRPWQHPVLAFGLMMKDGGIEASWRRRAQAAMDELRLVLPKLLLIDFAHTEFFDRVAAVFAQFDATGESFDPPMSNMARGSHARRDALLSTIYHSLLELKNLPDLVPRRRPKEWHRTAIELLLYYQAIVDSSCGVSADGPAVRFIRRALEALGERPQELGAIEQVLRRFRRRYPRGDPLALPVIPPTEYPPEPDTPTSGS